MKINVTEKNVKNLSDDELFYALQKNHESQSPNWEKLCDERDLIEAELARRS